MRAAGLKTLSSHSFSHLGKCSLLLPLKKDSQMSNNNTAVVNLWSGTQVADQCDAVAHMAEALARVHRDKAKMFRQGILSEIIAMNGEETAGYMEWLGETLNNMDATDEKDDAWLAPVFERAHALAQGIEARSDTTRSGVAEGESPVPQECAQGGPDASGN
jgi:hypothetical protein